MVVAFRYRDRNRLAMWPRKRPTERDGQDQQRQDKYSCHLQLLSGAASGDSGVFLKETLRTEKNYTRQGRFPPAPLSARAFRNDDLVEAAEEPRVSPPKLIWHGRQ